MAEFVTIYWARNLIEAAMVKDRLVDESIDALVVDKHMATLYPHMDAVCVKVQVPAIQVDAARNVVKKYEQKSGE